MSGSTNFQQFNPTAANQESDSQYAADPLRSGGASSGAILPSNLFNKLAYQLSTGMLALMQAMANKGYTCTDASVSALTATLQNIMTLADMAPYALLNSPAFTGSPTAPTPASGDNSQRIANTAWVAAYFATIAWVNATFASLSYVQANYAPLVSPHLSGSPTAPTAATGDSSSNIANTSWVQNFIASKFGESDTGNLGAGQIQLGPSGLILKWWFQTTPGPNYNAGDGFYVSLPGGPFPNQILVAFASNAYTPAAGDFTTWNVFNLENNSLWLSASNSGLRSCTVLAIGR
jgi:hypothetical protein